MKMKNKLERMKREARAIRRELYPPRGPTQPWILRRPELGMYETLMIEWKRENVDVFTNRLRMRPEVFQEIVNRLDPYLNPPDPQVPLGDLATPLG